MVRHLLPRLPLLRTIVSRVPAVSLLPVSRLRPLAHLHSAVRPIHPRSFHLFTPRRDASPTSRDSPPQSTLSTLPNATLSQRLKQLIKSYGWYALGVYVVLSALDFGVAFAGIHLLGADYVSQIAISVKNTAASVFHGRPADPGLDELDSPNDHVAHNGREGLYAMLVLAYTIHKTVFLPVRVGLTAALTPKLVSWLSRRGWTGSEGTKRIAAEMRERLRDKRDTQC